MNPRGRPRGRPPNGKVWSTKLGTYVEPRVYKCDEGDCGMVTTNLREFKTHVAQHKWGPHKIVKDATSGALSFQCLHPGCGKIVTGTSKLKLR